MASGFVAIQCRWPVPHIILLFAGGLQQTGGQHAAPEGILVKLSAQDSLMDLLEVEEREGLWKELEGHGAIVELAPEALHREAEDLSVIKGKGKRPTLGIQGFHRAAYLVFPGHNKTVYGLLGF